MQNHEHGPADGFGAPWFKHDDSSSRVQLSANMTHRLEKLARLRIDPSRIKFPEDGRKYEGGYATVSRGFLASSPDDTKEQVLELNVGSLTSGYRPVMTEGDNEGRGAAGCDAERKPRNEVVAQEREQELDGETSGRREAVAVKKMKMKVKTPDDVVRVLGLTVREAEFLVKLSHQNIIKLEGFVEDVSKEMIWLVFPWEDNGNLKDFVALHDWEIPERISLIYDITTGLEYLHSRNPPILHGDLKSINVLVNSKYRAVITDFGSARHLVTDGLNGKRERKKNEPQDARSPEATFCASTNTITLTCNQYTLRWAAPELLEENDAGLASDMWALGCVVYEVMTNSIPFQDVKDAVVIKRVTQGDLPSISSDARMLLIQALCSIVGQCWNIDPSQRPTAEESRKSINWMPMIIPNPVRTADAMGSADRSPELLMKLGYMHRCQNDYPNASKHYAQALGIYTDIADSKGRARALLELAHIHRVRNECSQAVTLYSECLQIQTDVGDRPGRASALFGLAEVHRLRNEHNQAGTFYSECLQIWTEIGAKRGKADALYGLAGVHLLRREYSQAIACYSEAAQILTDTGDGQRKASALCGLAMVHRHWKEYSQAMTFYSDALKIFAGSGDKFWRAFTLQGIGDVYCDQDDHSSAVHHYEQAAELFKQIGKHDLEDSNLKQAANVRRLMEQKVVT